MQSRSPGQADGWFIKRHPVILLKTSVMKRAVATLMTIFLLALGFSSQAQCSICTKTAQQLGEKPAKALNGGIIYLATTPLAIMAIMGYRWFRANRDMF